MVGKIKSRYLFSKWMAWVCGAEGEESCGCSLQHSCLGWETETAALPPSRTRRHFQELEGCWFNF